MAMSRTLTPETIEAAVTGRVVAEIRADLKSRIMPMIEAQVDEAVDGIVAALGPSLKVQITENMADWSREMMLTVKTRHLKQVDRA